MIRLGLAIMISLLFPSASSASVDSCSYGAKIDTDTLKNFVKDHKYILIGEGHGRSEIGPIIEELLCKLSSAGKSVLFSWELPQGMDEEIMAFVRNKKGTSLEGLMRADYWKAAQRSGIGSLAKLKTLIAIRDLNRNGANIFVAGVGGLGHFSLWSRELYPDYEASTYYNLRNWGESLPMDYIVHLSGSRHVKIIESTDKNGNITHRPLGSMFGHGEAISVRINSFKGTAWSLIKTEQGEWDSGVHKVHRKHLSELPKNVLIPLPEGSFWNAHVILDEVTASPPAFQQWKTLIKAKPTTEQVTDD